MKKNNIEIRAIKSDLKVEEGGRTVSGLVIPVNSRSELLYDKKGIRFYEIISPFAVTDDLIKNNDVRVFLDHDSTQGTFARSKYGEGSLKLEVTDKGLEFSFDAPITAMGDVMIEGINRGDYDAMSFAFISNMEKEEITMNEDGTYNRTVNEILWLGEISVLSQAPAYEDTAVDVRSLNSFVEKRKNEILANLDSKLAEINSL